MAIAPGGPQIVYYALPSQVALDRMPKITHPLAIAFQVKRWLRAQSQYGYMGIGNCNALATRFYWHYPCEFLFDSRGV